MLYKKKKLMMVTEEEFKTWLLGIGVAVTLSACSGAGGGSAATNAATVDTQTAATQKTNEDDTASASAQVTGVYLTGTLEVDSDSNSKDLVKGRKVDLQNESGQTVASAVSDNNGVYLFNLKDNNLVTGKNQFKIFSIIENDSKGKVRAVSQTVDVGRFDPTTRILNMGISFFLEISAIKGIVSFVDGDGKILKDVDLGYTDVFLPGFSFAARTNADGVFLLLYVPANTYTLRIENKSIVYETSVTVEKSTTLNLGVIVINADSTPPQNPSISIDAGKGYTNVGTVSLALSADGAETMYITNSPGCTSLGQWQPYSTAYASWPIELIGDAASVYVKYKDAAGNETQCISARIAFDKTAPSNPSIAIKGGYTYTKSSTVTLQIDATDADEMLLSREPSCSGSDWVPYASTRDWTLSKAGSNEIYAIFRDKAGNTSSCVSTHVALDTQAPTGSLQFSTTNAVRNGNQWYQKTNDATLILSASDNVDGLEVKIGTSASCNDGIWENFASTKIWPLQIQNAANTVYGMFRDEAGNTSDCISATIYHDTNAPSGTAIFSPNIGAMNNNVHYFGPSVSATVEFSVTDAVGGVMVLLSPNSNCSGGSYENLASSMIVSLPNTNAINQLYVRWKDALGNESSCALADSIHHDNAAPTVSTLQFDHTGAIQNLSTNIWYTTATEATLNVVASDISGDVKMKVSTDANCAISALGYVSVADVEQTLSTSGPTTVYVRFKDALGNETSCMQDTIGYDNSAPVVFPTASFDPSTGEIIKSGVTYTKEDTKTVSLSWDLVADTGVGGPYKVWLTDDCSGTPSWQAQADTIPWTLPSLSSNGLKTLYMKIQDALGNISDCSTGISIYRDTVADGRITNSGALYTNTGSITLSLVDADPIGLKNTMKVSGDDNCGGSTTAESFATTKSWTHNIAANNSSKVCVQFTDNLDNVTCSCVNLMYDTTAPVAVSTFSNGLSAWHPNKSPMLSWDNATDTLSGVAKYQVAIGTSAGGTDVTNYTDLDCNSPCQLKDITYPNQETSPLYFYPTIRAVDRAGNPSQETQGTGFWVRNGGRLTGDGGLDSTFSTAVDGGRDVFSYGIGETYSYYYNTKIASLALQGDGKVLACGKETLQHNWQYTCTFCNQTHHQENYASSLAYRIGFNGGRDSSFGSSGSLYLETALYPDGTAIGSTPPECSGITLLSNGGSAVTGRTNSGNIMLKFLSSAGAVSSSMSLASGFGRGLLERTSSSVLASIYSDSASNLALTDAAGTNFASTSPATDSPWTGPTQLIEQDDGKFIVAGPNSSGGIAVVRFASSGSSTDTSIAVNTMTTVSGMTLQSDGAIIVTGENMSARLTGADLTLDTGFGSAGIYTHPTNCVGNAVIVQDDGYILFVGTCASKMSVWRVLPNGSGLDTTFANNGQYTYPSTSLGNAAWMQTFGGLIVGGQIGNDSAVFRIK